MYNILKFLNQNIRIRNSSLECPAQEYGCLNHIYRQEFYFFMTGVDLHEEEYIYIIVFNATLWNGDSTKQHYLKNIYNSVKPVFGSVVCS